VAKLFRDYPRQASVIVALLLVSGLAEGFGIATVMPLLSSISGPQAGPPDRLTRMVHEVFAAFGVSPTMTAMLVVIIAAMLLKAVITTAIMRQVGFTMAAFGHGLRESLLNALLRCRWSYFTRQPVGELANTFTTESHRAVAAFWAATMTVTMALQIAIYLALAALVSWTVTVGAILAGFGLFAVLNHFIRLARSGGEQSARAYAELSRRIVDGIAGIKPVKAMAREERLAPMLEAENDALFVAQQKLVISKETLTAVQEPLIVIFLAIGLYVLTSFGATEFDVLIMMALLFQRIVSRLGRLQSSHQALVSAESFYSRIERKIADARASEERHAGRRVAHLRRRIEFRDVRFSYGERLVLDSVSVVIPVGRMTTVFGPSGSGKSTLVDLVLALQTADAGEILIDGTPISEIDIRAWRQEIGYVPQDLFLFHDSVRRNVSLNDPTVPDAEIERALREAGAWEFVRSLPQGLDTTVGERGATVSGGQRQRIAIARALLRRPRLLILDEPTTALDPATEAEICETLARLSREVTVLAISHQKALSEAADLVYRLEAGRVVEVEERERRRMTVG
jgi:ATP-binding cassette subfamily C protein